MYTVRKLFKFEAAHQLASAYSRACSETVHGHSYRVEVFFRSRNLDANGMVIDFGAVTDMIKAIIMHWDHALIVPASFGKNRITALRRTNKKLYVSAENPTAEWMAKHLYDTIRAVYPVLLYKVRVHETDTGYAEYALSE